MGRELLGLELTDVLLCDVNSLDGENAAAADEAMNRREVKLNRAIFC
jgi:hypothetical protein